jgi:hypothetical protein
MSDSEDDGFKQNPGEALEMGEDQFDSEDQLEEDEEDLQPEPLSKPAPKPAASNIKGTHVDNQHHDLAVDVNDSEEIDSEEEEDEMPAENEHKPTMPQHTQ